MPASTIPNEKMIPPVVVSVRTAARLLDLCPDTVRSLVGKGKLDYVNLTGQKGGILWASIQKLAGAK